MPIFMDRHDMKGTTAEEIAEAHLKDLEIQDKYGVKYLTYWFDHERGTTFCLVDAPDKEAAERVHREAHGAVAHEMIEVDLSAVEAFLGRIHDPASDPSSGRIDMDAGLRAVMFTDIAGSTEMTARLGDVMSVEIVRAHDSLVHRALAQHNGREVKHTGDGIMASFNSIPSAVDCAATIQRSFVDYNAKGGEPIHVGIGIHAGEPIEDSDDLFGSTVQLASRICDTADPDGVVVSDVVRQASGAVQSFTDLGHRDFKGFGEPIQVFDFDWR